MKTEEIASWGSLIIFIGLLHISNKPIDILDEPLYPGAK